MSVTAKTGKKQAASRFKKGVSGNPRGRRAGSRNKATIVLEKMMADDGEGVVNAVLEAAKGGDMQAARIICQRRSKTRPCGGVKVGHFGSVRSLSP